MAGKMMPNNFEAEQSILGAILIEQEVAIEAVAALSASDFYYEQHRIIFDAMQYLMQCRKPVDIITLSDRLENTQMIGKCGGVAYITELTDILPSAANWKYYLAMVQRDSLLRKLIGCSQKIIENSYGAEDAEHALAYAEKEIFEIGKERETSSLTHVSDAANEVMKKLEGILSHTDDSRGLMSGFYNLDDITNGFLPAQLIVVAARPGCGKTSFAMNIVANIAQKTPYKKIACFNLEMSTTELTQRLVCNIAHVKMSKALKGELNQEDIDRLWKAKRVLDESNIYIDDSALITPEEILSKCRRLSSQKNGLDLIVIDYLQLMSAKDRKDSKQQEISDISRSMKILAKELKVPVIVMSQMSRAVEKRDDKTPKLSDLRESGAIEQDADMVFFLNREEGDNDSGFKPITLIIAKHRNGPTGEIYYMFDGDSVKFTMAKKNDIAEQRRIAKEKEKAESKGGAETPDAKKTSTNADAKKGDAESAVNASESDAKSVDNGVKKVAENADKAAQKVNNSAADDNRANTGEFEKIKGDLPFDINLSNSDKNQDEPQYEQMPSDEDAPFDFDDISGDIDVVPKNIEE